MSAGGGVFEVAVREPIAAEGRSKEVATGE
jgi:hypothetical protein